MASCYDIGNTVRFFIEFTDENGDATDPADISLLIRKVEDPKAAAIAVEMGDLDNPVPGQWQYYWQIPTAASSAGSWAYRYEADFAGDRHAAKEARIVVHHSYMYD